MNKEIFNLFKRMGFFLLPFLFLILLYVILDPFKVIKKYDSYIMSDEISAVTLNRHWVSTSTFENNNALYQYNSFIFGNSCSIFYEIEDWKCHIDSSSNCFHFDAFGESLYALNKKVKYLDNKNVAIDNALLILDHSLLEQTVSQTSHIGIIAPQLENYKNIHTFHLKFIKAFLTPRFLVAYVDYKIRGEIKPYMKKDFLLNDVVMHYCAKTNEISYPYYERLIDEGKYYTPERMNSFLDRDLIKQSFSPMVIFDTQKQMLQEINDIFKKHNTDFKVIINPLYYQIKLNEYDVAYLCSLFGKERVFDFSGINDITNDFHNYYDIIHYRPHVSRQIMDLIYKKFK